MSRLVLHSPFSRLRYISIRAEELFKGKCILVLTGGKGMSFSRCAIISKNLARRGARIVCSLSAHTTHIVLAHDCPVGNAAQILKGVNLSGNVSSSSGAESSVGPLTQEEDTHKRVLCLVVSTCPPPLPCAYNFTPFIAPPSSYVSSEYTLCVSAVGIGLYHFRQTPPRGGLPLLCRLCATSHR